MAVVLASVVTPLRAAADRRTVEVGARRETVRADLRGRQGFRHRAVPGYAVELEPHVLFPWTGLPRRTAATIGLGFRASIPIIQQGPLGVLDDNLAISFGLDWAHLGRCDYDDDYCGGNDLWIPIVAQWNLFLTPWWSIFPELGVAIHHASWRWTDPGPGPRGCGPGERACVRYRDALTELSFATWIGTRLSLSDTFSFVFRVGFPSVTLGVSFRI